MNSEQEKINRFFDKLSVNGIHKITSRISIVCLFFLVMMCSAIPAQNIYREIGEGPLYIPGVITMFSFWMLYLRTSHYRSYLGSKQGKLITELLQYYPVSKRELWKIKMKCAITFQIKITLVGLLIQLISSYAYWGKISVLEFIHIAAFVFLFPIAGEIIFDGLVGRAWELG